MMAAEYLQAAQLVARVGDAVGGVRAEHVHLLELANHGGTVVGDGGADARQHGIVGAQVFLSIVQIWRAALEIDSEFERVKYFGLVPAVQCRFLQPPRAVRVGAARENGKFH